MGPALEAVIKKTLPHLVRTAPLARLLLLARELVKSGTRPISEKNHQQRLDIINRLNEVKAQIDKECAL